jgi:general secretion pathway protein I
VSRDRYSGFTLIEVLVALVIVAVGMSVLMGVLSSSAKTVIYMQDKTLAQFLALNLVANDRLQLGQGQVPPVSTGNGDIDYASRSWHWRQDVVATQVPGIMRIDIKVRPKEIKGGDDDSWYVTVSGLAGSAIGMPGSSELMVSWDAAGGTSTNGTTAGTPTKLTPQNGTPNNGGGLGGPPSTGTTSNQNPTPNPNIQNH